MDNANGNQNEKQTENKNMMCNKCVYFHEHLFRSEKEKKKNNSFDGFVICILIILVVIVTWYVVAFDENARNWEIRITKTSNGIDVNYYDYDQMIEDVQKEYDDFLE